jgi:hypothetical protein
MEIEMAGFDRERKMQREAQLKQHRRDLEEARRSMLSEQNKYVTQKNKDTLMGASLEEAKGAWDTRKRLLDQNKDLEMGIKVGYDMESIAIDAKTNLQAQT